MKHQNVLGMLGLIALLCTEPMLGHSKTAPSQPVDLNAASAEQLMQLPGIGKARADAIVTARQMHPFASTQDLLHVPGIGAKRLEQLAPYITVANSAGAKTAPVK